MNKEKNSLIEVYVEYFKKHTKTKVELIGETVDPPDFGLYHLINPSGKYLILLTDSCKYADKRIKNDSMRYRNSTFFLYPMEKKYSILNRETIIHLFKFLNDEEDTKIIMEKFQDIEEAIKYLKE